MSNVKCVTDINFSMRHGNPMLLTSMLMLEMLPKYWQHAVTMQYQGNPAKHMEML